ncbi:hypothetical protein L7F22_057565 [Adiantum nelumboides]|nr:hypothetical protein [Adiantum nelumboides]
MNFRFVSFVERGNWGVVLAIWTPVIMVFLMDTQIWYALWSAIFGAINGGFLRLGEIRSLEMLRSRFRSLPGAFDARLVHLAAEETHSKSLSFDSSFAKVALGNGIIYLRFSQLWNEIVNNLRNEDLLDNIQKDLLLIPCSLNPSSETNYWPAFLLANKVPKALNMVKKVTDVWTDEDLFKALNGEEYMTDGINEFYQTFFCIINSIVVGKQEKRILLELKRELDQRIVEKRLLNILKINAMPLLYLKFIKLLDILEQCNPEKLHDVSSLIQDMLEIYTTDIKRSASYCEHGRDLLELCMECSLGSSFSLHGMHRELFDSKALSYPPQASEKLLKQIKRLRLLMLPEESAVDIPTNPSARRRLIFFASSLFMEIPNAPNIQSMVSFSVLNPYYDEETLFPQPVLEEENDDGVSILDYLQHIFSDEWANFQERINGADAKLLAKETCKWASYRLPTLARTVRGMSYYQKALELQAFLDTASENEIFERFKAHPSKESSPQSSSTDIQALVNIKFSYVVSCQDFALFRRTQDYRQLQLLELLKEYPILRLAYIDEVEGAEAKEYYSVLVKGSSCSDFYQEVYRIKLPGDPMIGQGKSENQNHAVVFSRGEMVQVVDMDEDNYLEEALKMRNFLQEFQKNSGVGAPSILGMREHNFTESNTSLAGFITSQESSFVTIGQRILVNPLRIRFHYGHSDVFDRLFHLSRGGLSKASRLINSSESIYAGFNTTLRGGSIMHKQYIQVGKGHNVRFDQISRHYAKSAVGNAEQIMSRDIYRLGHHLDFFRMLSLYFTTVGDCFSNLIIVLTVYTFLYGRLYLALSGLESALDEYVALQSSNPLQVALASECFVIFGFFMAAPVVAEIGLERGFRRAFRRFLTMQLKLASFFFTFSIGTKAHFFGRTLLHGRANFPQRADRHEFFLHHEKFAQIYRLYSRSHFTKAIEISMLLIVYHAYGASGRKNVAYFFLNFSLWLLVGAWLFAPFFFNPQGLEWQRTVEDWFDWLKWINSSGKRGMSGIKSWESWWEEEQSHISTGNLHAQLSEIILSTRFLLYQYGVVYHLNIVHQSKNIVVYVLSWLVVIVALAMLQIVATSRRWLRQKERRALNRKVLKQNPRILVRFLKVGVVAAIILVLTVLFVAGGLTLIDVFASILAFIPSGWALLQVSLACRGLMEKIGIWNSLKELARCYDYMMGIAIFAPVAALSWIPAVSDFQVCILFNRPFLNFLVSRQQRWKNKAWFLNILPKNAYRMDKSEDSD